MTNDHANVWKSSLYTKMMLYLHLKFFCGQLQSWVPSMTQFKHVARCWHMLHVIAGHWLVCDVTPVRQEQPVWREADSRAANAQGHVQGRTPQAGGWKLLVGFDLSSHLYSAVSCKVADQKRIIVQIQFNNMKKWHTKSLATKVGCSTVGT